MAKIRSSKQVNGTFGAVWVNNVKWFDINKFDSKVNFDYEDVNMAEDLATHKKLIGWNGEGTIEVKKVYSRGAKLMADVIKTGIVPEIKIVTKLDDPDSYGTERASFGGVTFNQFTPAAFEQKTLMTEELTFNFSECDIIEQIEALAS